MMTKKIIRKNISTKRNMLTQTEIKEKSNIIQKKIKTLILNKNANIISSYININSEVITSYINRYIIENNIILAIPKIENKEIKFYQIKNYKKELEIGHYSIPEPKTIEKIHPDKIQLAIIPALAFDRKGNRLGYGKGYFDKFLAINKRIIKVGIAFDMQIIKHIPKEKYDQAMDYIITEKQNIYLGCQNTIN